MKSSRNIAIIVGILFIIGTASGILSAVFTGSILSAPDYLTQVAANETQMITGAFFVLLMGLSLAMVPVMMFPIFKKQNEALALGTVVFRGPLEAGVYILMVISWLLLIVLSQESVNAGVVDNSQFQALGAVLLKANEVINPVLEIVFSLGALMFYTLFYQTRLIPRWLSGWGLIGAVVYLAAGVMALFGTETGFLLALLGLQEMVMALWLIVKGFSSSAILSEITK
ncbi:MAG: DUF4386 domain-containing protein [Anaerolineales bacterium]|jgi:hypothetical protein